MAMLQVGMGATSQFPVTTGEPTGVDEFIGGAKVWLNPGYITTEMGALWDAATGPGKSWSVLVSPRALGFLLVPAAVIALVWGMQAAKRRRARNPRRLRRRNPRRRVARGRRRNPRDARGVDGPMVSELVQFIENDSGLYRQQHTPINKNLTAKKARGMYDHNKAVKLFGYLVESGMRKYAKEFGSEPWHEMAGTATRRAVAEGLTRTFEEEYSLGNYDNFIPAKYGAKNPKRRRNAGPRSVRHTKRRMRAGALGKGKGSWTAAATRGIKRRAKMRRKNSRSYAVRGTRPMPGYVPGPGKVFYLEGRKGVVRSVAPDERGVQYVWFRRAVDGTTGMSLGNFRQAAYIE